MAYASASLVSDFDSFYRGADPTATATTTDAWLDDELDSALGTLRSIREHAVQIQAAQALDALGIAFLEVREPGYEGTNGKAERLIQTALHEWAYARSYVHSDQRAAHLPHWLHHYNWHRPHASLDYKTPISRLGLDVNNLVGLHT